MKQAYSQYVRHCLMPSDDITIEDVKAAVINAWEKHMDRPMTDKDLAIQTMLQCNCIIMEKKLQEGDCLHIFFTGYGMHDWLRDCGQTFQDEQLNMIVNVANEYRKDTRVQSGQSAFLFMLHFLGGNSPAYLCVVQKGGRCVLGGKDWENWTITCSRGRGKSMVYFTVNQTTCEDGEINGIVSVVSSALSYMKCFPDTIMDGIPSDLKHPNHYRNAKAISLNMHHSLVVRDGPCPHYRVGHFRLLQSPKFVHKQGEVVFVRGTFVKGKAKTVLSFEDEDALESRAAG
jgi:hypothetical protein